MTKVRPRSSIPDEEGSEAYEVSREVAGGIRRGRREQTASNGRVERRWGATWMITDVGAGSRVPCAAVRRLRISTYLLQTCRVGTWERPDTCSLTRVCGAKGN